MKLVSRLLLLSLFGLPSSYALTPDQNTTVGGNPINSQDNYTINSERIRKVTVACQFSNSGKVPAQINIWTAPEQSLPTKTVLLKPGQTGHPYQFTEYFEFILKPMWWCHIYLTADTRNWKFCNYFSISDAVIKEYRPFATWNKTSQSKETYYTCKITKPTEGAAFFYFK